MQPMQHRIKLILPILESPVVDISTVDLPVLRDRQRLVRCQPVARATPIPLPAKAGSPTEIFCGPVGRRLGIGPFGDGCALAPLWQPECGDSIGMPPLMLGVVHRKLLELQDGYFGVIGVSLQHGGQQPKRSPRRRR